MKNYNTYKRDLSKTWKIVDHDGTKVYVSEDGEVWSVPKTISYTRKDGIEVEYENTEKPLSITMGNYGYLKTTVAPVHRLVADAFIPNPKGLNQVRHKDGDKLNNHYTNLERYSSTENVLNYYKTDKALKDGKRNVVEVYDENNNLVREFNRQKDLAKWLGVTPAAVTMYFRQDNQYTLGGYKIKRKSYEDVIKERG